jgi:SAM-dependent methyltransferase
VSTRPTPAADPDPQAGINADVWRRGRYVRYYASRELRPAEVLVLVRHREKLEGDVLELGCGAGRLTGYLAELARSARGIDLSPQMIDYCRRRYPRGIFDVGDLRDLAPFADGSFDAVIATWNVLDVLGEDERARVLREIRRILVPGGLLLMSSHNLAYVPRLKAPTDLRARNLVRRAGRLALMPARQRHHRALAGMERSAGDHAIVNDDAHGYRLLHYYVSRDAQERQLRDAGLDFLECLDNDGHTVGPGEQARDHVELYYLASRPTGE